MDLMDDFTTPLEGWIAILFYCVVGVFILLALYAFVGLFLIRIYEFLFSKKYIIFRDSKVSQNLAILKEYYRLLPLTDFYTNSYTAMDKIDYMEENGCVVTIREGTVCKIKGFHFISDYTKIIVEGQEYYIKEGNLKKFKNSK